MQFSTAWYMNHIDSFCKVNHCAKRKRRKSKTQKRNAQVHFSTSAWQAAKLNANPLKECHYNRPNSRREPAKFRQIRSLHKLYVEDVDFIFIEVELSDPSAFDEETLFISGQKIEGFPVLSCKSPAIANAIAATLLHLRDTTNTIPHVYFGWTEGNPVSYIFKYVFLGEGETAPVTREILRRAERDPARRPKVIVG